MKTLVKEYRQSSKFSGKKKAEGQGGWREGPPGILGEAHAPLVKAGILRQQRPEVLPLQFALPEGSAKYKGTAVFGMNACAHADCPGRRPSFRGHRPPRLLLCTPLTPVSRTPESSLHFGVKDSRASKDTVIPGLGFRKALCLRRFSELAVPTSRDGDGLQRLQQRDGQTE